MNHVIETPGRRIDINFRNSNIEITFTNQESELMISVELTAQELGTLLPILKGYYDELTMIQQWEHMAKFSIKVEP